MQAVAALVDAISQLCNQLHLQYQEVIAVCMHIRVGAHCLASATMQVLCAVHDGVCAEQQ
jgi:hypothetical protein